MRDRRAPPISGCVYDGFRSRITVAKERVESVSEVVTGPRSPGDGFSLIDDIVLPCAVRVRAAQDVGRSPESFGTLNDRAIAVRVGLEPGNAERIPIGIVSQLGVAGVRGADVKIGHLVIAKSIDVIFIEPLAVR